MADKFNQGNELGKGTETMKDFNQTAVKSMDLQAVSSASTKGIKPNKILCINAQAKHQLSQLRKFQSDHPLWKNSLFKAFKSGSLGLADLQFIFGQYSFYSRSFTRCLAGFMANSDNDMHRAQLVENLWEESGEADLDKRHAELFRRFLTHGLGIILEELVPAPPTQIFVSEILSFCLRSSAYESSAFLSLGTEGIVSRMYEIFIKGLKKAGVSDEHLTFFYLHIACDDDHAITLEQIMLSYADHPDWFETCRRSLTFALDLRTQFFEHLYQQLQVRRIHPILENIQAQKSLAISQQGIKHEAQQSGEFLYQNKSDWGKQKIDFTVERVAFPAEVLDARVVRIAPHKTNERHHHAHEAIFLVKAGQGIIRVDKNQYDVEVDDIVFIPRWAVHQVKNTGDKTLVILAITDFGLTNKAFVGNYLKTARMHVNRDADYSSLSN